jgi:cytochrome P450
MTMTSDPILALADSDALRDPGPCYALLREHRPVHWHDSLQTLLVSRYADAVTVLRDSTRFGSDFRRAGEDLPPAAISVQTLDPPEHTGIRHLLVDAFRRLNWPTLRREMEQATLTRLAALAQRTRFDFVTEFAEPLAWSTVLSVLGVAGPELTWFGPVASAIVDGMDAGIWPEFGAPAMAARAELSRLTDGWLDGAAGDHAAGGRAGTGVVAFAAAQADERGVDRTVLDNTLRVLVHAGYTSASKILSLGAATLLSRPGALAGLAGGDLGTAVDELVRFESPVRALARVCVTQTKLGGHPLRPGDVVTVLVGAANRDPATFTKPNLLRLGRSPNPHLGFGRGAHSCLGAKLAAVQAGVVFAALARHYPRAQLVAAPVFRRNLTLRGLAKLEVTLREEDQP